MALKMTSSETTKQETRDPIWCFVIRSDMREFYTAEKLARSEAELLEIAGVQNEPSVHTQKKRMSVLKQTKM